MLPSHVENHTRSLAYPPHIASKRTKQNVAQSNPIYLLYQNTGGRVLSSRTLYNHIIFGLLSPGAMLLPHNYRSATTTCTLIVTIPSFEMMSDVTAATKLPPPQPRSIHRHGRSAYPVCNVRHRAHDQDGREDDSAAHHDGM